MIKWKNGDCFNYLSLSSLKKKEPNLKMAGSGTKPQSGLPLPKAGKETKKESNGAGLLNTSLIPLGHFSETN